MTTTSVRPLAEVSSPVDPGISPRNHKKAHALGLTSATGLLIGSIVGAGVFAMPGVIGETGTMGIIVFGVIAVGAMLLAVLFGQVTNRVPNSDGGLYAHARHEYGDFTGYLVGWCYWIQASAASIVFDQAEDRFHTIKAVMVATLSGTEQTARS